MFNGIGNLDAQRERFAKLFLTDRISVQRAEKVRDEYGDIVSNFHDVEYCAAIVEPISGRELESMGYSLDTMAFSVSTRHDVDIRMGDRIIWQDRILAVTQSLNADTNQILLEVIGIERVK